MCNLALKLGLRDQEVQFAEFTDISGHESVFRVRSKLKYEFTVKDYEQRDIPIPTDFLGELKVWKQAHPDQNLIVPNTKGNSNTKQLWRELQSRGCTGRPHTLRDWLQKQYGRKQLRQQQHTPKPLQSRIFLQRITLQISKQTEQALLFLEELCRVARKSRD